MKKITLLSFLVFGLILFTSCGEAKVAGKRFVNIEYPLEIDFNENSEKVFYLTQVCNYKIEKNFVIVNVNGKEIKLILEKECLSLYDENTKKGSDFAFILQGNSKAFSNQLKGQSFEKNGIKITFNENSAECGNYTIDYSFNPETCEYKLDGFDATVYTNAVKNNCYDTFVAKAFNKTESSLNYEKAWWLYQKMDDGEVTKNNTRIYAASYHKDEYNEAKDDEFAMNKLLTKIKPEFIEKFNSVNTNEKFTIYQSARIGKYDFNRGGFLLNTSLNFDDIESKFNGDETSIEPRLCCISESRGWINTRSVDWLSDINTKLYLLIDEGKAEKLNNEFDENRNAIISYTVKPVMERDVSSMTMSALSSKNYIMYYEFVSAKVLNTKNMEVVGNVKLLKTW